MGLYVVLAVATLEVLAVLSLLDPAAATQSAWVLVADVVEALVPGLFPTWMRVEMVGVAVLMAAVVLVNRSRRA